MQELSTFNFEDKQVRIAVKDNNIMYFRLLDVLPILGLESRAISKFNLDDSGVVKIATPTNGGIQDSIFVSESNLYRIIFRSNKPEAVKFQDWVFNEVLPNIRQHGFYGLSETPLTYIDSLKLLIKREEEKLKLEQTNHELNHRKEVARLDNGKSTYGASVKQVNDKTNGSYKWQPLKQWCIDNNVIPHTALLNNYSSLSVTVYPYQAWLDIYELDLNQLFKD